MPVNVKEQLYTMEQLALIKRLRESGISKQQVEYIYDSYDRLDKDLGTLYHIPVALELHAQALQQIQQLALGLSNLQNAAASVTPVTSLYKAPVVTQNVKPTSALSTNDEDRRKLDQLIQLAKQENMHSHSDPGFSTSTGAGGSYSDILSEVDSPEFREFVSQGEAACCEEIRNFVAANCIKQHQVSSLAGICQTYVSRYMKGEFAEMSERSRKTIQKWYLTYRNDPAAIGRAASVAQLLNGGAGNGSSSGTPNIGTARRPLDVSLIANNPSFADLLSTQRRERFVFRPSQLEILERRFMQNSYPTYEDRVEIAGECCAVAETIGRKLNEREAVSVSVISNWFANKRKDLKKAAKEGGVDLCGMLMTRRGRPPRPLTYNVKMESVEEWTTDDGTTADDSSGLMERVERIENGTAEEQEETCFLPSSKAARDYSI